MGCNGCAWEWLSRFLGVLCVNSVSQGFVGVYMGFGFLRWGFWD